MNNAPEAQRRKTSLTVARRLTALNPWQPIASIVIASIRLEGKLGQKLTPNQAFFFLMARQILIAGVVLFLGWTLWGRLIQFIPHYTNKSISLPTR